MSVKEMYEYVYYKIYKLMSATPGAIDWRASAFLLLVEAFTLFSLILYYQIFIDRKYALPDNPMAWVPLIVIFLVGVLYFTLYSKNQWKAIIEKYDAWPKKRNRWGTLIVWTFIFLVIANLAYAFHLFSQVDWSLYR